MPYKINPITGRHDFYQAPTTTPDEVVTFDKLTPTTVGVVFTPDTQAAANTLYVSSVDASTWIYEGGAYVTKTFTSTPSTPFYIQDTTIDAGGNKTAPIQHNGYIKAYGFYGSGAGINFLNANYLAAGTVPTARLGTGTANSSSYLRGDGTWAVIANGGKVGIPNQTTGIFTYYSTLEDARDTAVSGDTIVVFPGTYTVTTTATNGLAKDGVNYYFHAGTIINKATSGDIFNETGFTNPCNIYGFGTFNKTTTTGRILYNTTLNAVFEAIRCTSSTDTIFTTTKAKIKFTVDYATSSGGYVLRMDNSNSNSDSYVDINMIEWKSTSTSVIGSPSWWYYTTLRITGSVLWSTVATTIKQYNTAVKLHLNVGQILGLTYGLESGDGYGGNPHIINCNYCSGIADVGKPYILSGEFNTLVYTGTWTYSSYVQGGRFNTITLNGSGHIKGTLAGIGSSSVATITQSGGVIDVDVDSAHYGIGFNITGGVCNILSYRTQAQLSSNTDRIVNGGTLNLYAALTHGGGTDSGRWYAVKLQSGTLRLFSNIYNNFNQDGSAYNGFEGSHGIVWVGGDLIIENATIVTTSTKSYPIKSNTAGLQLRVNGRLSHNRIEEGSVLAGKKHKYKYIVNSVATTAIPCNDGTGGDETFTVSDTVTYNTTAAIAARMVTLINASATLDITASQDTPGTDAYFYLEHDTIGYNFSVYGNNNAGTNLTASLMRIGSYPMTEIVGGTIIGDADVK